MALGEPLRHTMVKMRNFWQGKGHKWNILKNFRHSICSAKEIIFLNIICFCNITFQNRNFSVLYDNNISVNVSSNFSIGNPEHKRILNLLINCINEDNFLKSFSKNSYSHIKQSQRTERPCQRRDQKVIRVRVLRLHIWQKVHKKPKKLVKMLKLHWKLFSVQLTFSRVSLEISIQKGI